MPRRRCVGCGRIAPKSELVRLAATDQRASGEEGGRSRRAVLDATGTLPGRGAYLCRAGDLPKAECLRLAERRRGLARTLRCAVTLDPEIVKSLSGWRSWPQAGEPGPSISSQRWRSRLQDGGPGPSISPLSR